MLLLISVITVTSFIPVLEAYLPFIQQPVSQNVSLGSEPVIFNCTAKSLGYHWLVNGETLNTNENKNRGITKSDIIVDDAINLKIHLLTVPVNTMINDGITITCYVYTSVANLSDVATLQIQGLLGPVTELHAVWVDSSSILVSFTPPYTLDGVPIRNYTIDLDSSTAYTTNTTSTVISVNNSCTDHNITVTAWNDAGQGNETQVSLEKVSGEVQSCRIILDMLHPLLDELEVHIELSMNVNINCLDTSEVVMCNSSDTNCFDTNNTALTSDTVTMVTFTISVDMYESNHNMTVYGYDWCIPCGTLPPIITEPSSTSTSHHSILPTSSRDHTHFSTSLVESLLVPPSPSIVADTSSTTVVDPSNTDNNTTVLKISIASSVVVLLLLIIAIILITVVCIGIKWRRASTSMDQQGWRLEFAMELHNQRRSCNDYISAVELNQLRPLSALSS